MTVIRSLFAALLCVLGFYQSAAACAANDTACIGALHTDPRFCDYGYNPNCYPAQSYSPPPPQIIHVYDYLNLLWTADDQPYFFKTYYKSPYKDFDYAQADQDALDACNAHSGQSPCKHAATAIGDGCIAYLDTPDVLYGDAGETCYIAVEKVAQRCMQRYQDQNICANIQTKQPADMNAFNSEPVL